jgi:hypothetical protein
LTVASDTAVLGFACRRSEVYVSLGDYSFREAGVL